MAPIWNRPGSALVQRRTRGVGGPPSADERSSDQRAVERFRVEQIDLSSLAVDQRERELQRRIQQGVQQSIDSAPATHVNAQLIRLSSDAQVLILRLRADASVDWPESLFLYEVSAACQSAVPGNADEIPELPQQCASCVARHPTAKAAKRDADLEFWKQQLAGTPARLELPTDRPRTAGRASRAKRCRSNCPPL